MVAKNIWKKNHLVYNQIKLNILVEHCQFGYITKLGRGGMTKTSSRVTLCFVIKTYFSFGWFNITSVVMY
jgi:hypothetical protein